MLWWINFNLLEEKISHFSLFFDDRLDVSLRISFLLVLSNGGSRIKVQRWMNDENMNHEGDEDEVIRVFTWDLTFINSTFTRSQINYIHKRGKQLMLARGYDEMQKISVISQIPITFDVAFADIMAVCHKYPTGETIRDIRILISEDESQITPLI
jgi:hypothetical protein